VERAQPGAGRNETALTSQAISRMLGRNFEPLVLKHLFWLNNLPRKGTFFLKKECAVGK
jgi:hypothetical protein